MIFTCSWKGVLNGAVIYVKSDIFGKVNKAWNLGVFLIFYFKDFV